MEILKEILEPSLFFFSVVIGLFLILFGLKSVFKIKDYIFRKIEHIMALLSFYYLYFFETIYKVKAIIFFIMSILSFIALFLYPKIFKNTPFLVEKEKDELLITVPIFYLIICLLILIFDGFIKSNSSYIYLTSISLWGVGDLMAALIGIKFGKHKFKLKICNNKTLEGSLSMFIFSFLVTLPLLFFKCNLAPIFKILIAFTSCFIATIVELITPNNLDNITTPLVASLTLSLCLFENL